MTAPEVFTEMFSGLRLRFEQITLPNPHFLSGARVADPKRDSAEHFANLADVVGGVATVWEGLQVSGALDPWWDDDPPKWPRGPHRERFFDIGGDGMLTVDICEHINVSVSKDDSEIPTVTFCLLVLGLVRIASLIRFSGADCTKRLISAIWILAGVRREVYWFVEDDHMDELANRDPEGYETFRTYWDGISDDLHDD